MNEFLIKIRALFEGKGFSDASKGAEEAGKKIEESSGKTGGFSSRLTDCIGSATAFGGVIGQVVVAAFGAMVSAITKGIEVLAKFVEEFAASEEKIAALDAALAQNGMLTDAYRTKIQDLASELQKTTSIADDEWFGVLQRLTQFGADESNIDQYAEAVKNLAGILGGDIQTASLLVAKAMQGNFTAFSRYGISVDEAGSQTEKLNQLMEQLAHRGGGVLEAKSQSLNGQFRQLKNVTSDFFEALGSLISRTGILQKGLDLLTGAIRALGEMVPGVQPKLEGLKNKLPEIGSAAEEVRRKFKETADAVEDTGNAAVKLDTSGVDKMKQAADELAKSFDRARRESEMLQHQQTMLADAESGLELAKIDASGDDEVTKLQKKQEVLRRLAEKKNSIEEAADQRKIAIAAKERDAAFQADQAAFENANKKQQEADAAAERLNEAQRRENHAKRLQQGREALEAELKKEQSDKNLRVAARVASPTSAIFLLPAIVEGKKKIAELEKAIADRKEVEEKAGKGVSVKDAQADFQAREKAAREAALVAKEAQENRRAVDKKNQQEIDDIQRAGWTRNLLVPVQRQTQEVKDRSEMKKAVEKVVAEKTTAELAETVRAQENRIRELELANASPEKLAGEKSKLVDLKTDKKATPEQLRAAELEKAALRKQAKEEEARREERLEKEGVHGITGLAKEAETEIGLSKGAVPRGKGGGQLQKQMMEKARARVDAAQQALQDGVDPGELDELIASIEKYAEAAAAKGQAVDEKINKVIQAVNNLQSQTKNGAGR